MKVYRKPKTLSRHHQGSPSPNYKSKLLHEQHPSIPHLPRSQFSGPESVASLPPVSLGKIPQVQNISIGDGLQGNIDTIKFMIKMAREKSESPIPRKLATQILLEYGVPSHAYADEALAIGDFVKNHVRYVRDHENIEYLQDPLDLIKQIEAGTAQGDCDDMALLTATLLLTIGHQPHFRAVRYEELLGNYNHIYVVVYERNGSHQPERIVLDCILKDKPIGYETRHINGEEYPV